MTYKVLVYFEDLQDHRHPYHAGDSFPRVGYEPSAERIAELCGTNNKRGKAVIEPVVVEAVVQEEPVKPEKQEESFPMNEPADDVVTFTLEEPAKPKRGRKPKETD